MRTDAAQPRAAAPLRRLGPAALAVLAVATVACYWPVTAHYFAQDDFVLLERAAYHPREAVTVFFAAEPSPFRPWSKGLFFVAAYRLFGLDAFAYHLVSLLLHVFNVCMLWRVLRRLGVGEAAALAASAMFALSAAYFHVLAWISCIQQLMGLAFALVSLEWGFRAVASGSSRGRWLSFAAYVGAVGSEEQTLLIPVVLALYAWLRPADGSPRLRRALASTTPHWVLLVALGGFVLLWKGLPESGAYRFGVGGNVVVNLATYLDRSFHYWLRMPFVVTVDRLAFQWGHALAAALVIYHLARGRWREVVFGLGCFLALILPTLFLTEHQFYLHTYIPALGTTYLVALLLEDLLALRPLRAGERARSALTVGLVVFGALAWQAIHTSLTATRSDETGYRKSFVIRRAVTARNAHDSISRRRSRNPGRVTMVYGRPLVGDDTRWHQQNVYEALGRGSALVLFYDSPALEVRFVDMAQLDGAIPGGDVFVYDDHGNCLTPDEAGIR